MNQFNRAEIIDNNFLESLKGNSLPKIEQFTSLNDLNININEIVSIFESQVFSRHIDIKARELKDKGQCFYTIGSSGHESNAVFGNVFPFSDIAFLHYRSGPFFIERSKQIFGSTPLYDMALSFMASSEDPISGGRHKAKKFLTINVINAKSLGSAKNIAFSIANSPLVKTAAAGEDPNWGRIVMGIGKSGEIVDPKKLKIKIGNYLVAENGKVSDTYDEKKLKEYMEWDSIEIEVNLNL